MTDNLNIYVICIDYSMGKKQKVERVSHESRYALRHALHCMTKFATNILRDPILIFPFQTPQFFI